MLPAIELLDGAVIRPEQWRNTAAVIVFWSTTCTYCGRHNARMECLHRASRALPLRVLGVCQDRDLESVRRHAFQHGYTFPITLQGDELRPRLVTRRGLVPMTVTLDAAGRLHDVIPGEMSEDDVMSLLQLSID